jgi:hypothetical protein
MEDTVTLGINISLDHAAIPVQSRCRCQWHRAITLKLPTRVLRPPFPWHLKFAYPETATSHLCLVLKRGISSIAIPRPIESVAGQNHPLLDAISIRKIAVADEPAVAITIDESARDRHGGLQEFGKSIRRCRTAEILATGFVEAEL